MKDVTQLTEGWSLSHDGAQLDARVPGCVHTDLLAAGLIPDPFLGTNENDIAWVGRRSWTYTHTLGATGELATAQAHERTDLVFEGLDTAARISLGGQELGSTRNMHRSYRFDVTGRSGELRVEFASAYDEAAAVRASTGERPNVYPEPFQYIRKMACSFGWDWGPTVVTAGMWRPVRVEHWSTARITRVRPLVTVHDGAGRVELRVDLERTAQGADRPLVARAAVAGIETRAHVRGDAVTLVLDVPDVQLWWPRGYGEQPLYDVELTLHTDDAPTGRTTPAPAPESALDTWRRRVGFRTLELDQSPDEHGTGFTFVVNGERVFVRGVNWIPDDVLPSRITPERYRTRLTQAADANIDLVRIWGGGIYEDDAFYDICDELGLMVWQDFLFACSAYPEEQPLRGEVEAEARENVVRLMPHPSLVVWNGNNENLWGFRDWEWEDTLAGDSWGEGYYLGLLPRVVAELDPTRPYTAGSPWSGSWDHHPNDPDHGTYHSWEVWNRQDYTEYRADVPRFVSEFGWQAPPAMATLRDTLPGEDLAPDSPGMLHHQKAEDGNGKLNRGVERHFALPQGDFDRWHYLTQVVQARAVATGIEHWRANWPRCAGTIVWQLNDCWPVSSWSAVDGEGRLKPLHHELRRVYADRLLTLQPGTDGTDSTELVLANQGAEAWEASVTLRLMHADGTLAARLSLELTAPPREVLRLAVPPEVLPAAGSAKEYLVADCDGLRALHVPVRDREFGYPEPRYDIAVETVGSDRNTVDVVVSAQTLVRDLLLQPDRIAPRATADRGLITLLPGEQVRIRVHGAQGAGANTIRAALFCVEPA
ncbi:glycoside hydrolase family 2 protein [Streptomyces longisporoflavus]|uniref:beta-mannosidase n=1 Tax=Streptomyces longisporoflavus TaxID=28044 RepID=A0ABW7QGX6_9ACTN